MPQEIECRGLAAAEIDRDEPARIIALFLINADLFRIVEQRGIVDLPNLGMLSELLRKSLRVLALPVHPQSDSGQAGIENPALVRLQDVTEQTTLATNFRHERHILGKRNAADDIAVAAEILGRRVNRYVRSQSKRVLESRSQESVVDHDQRPLRRMSVSLSEREGGDRFACPLNIGHHDGWISGGFNENNFEVLRAADG